MKIRFKDYFLYNEAVIPFNKTREVRKGMIKKHGMKAMRPYTFGFDIEFYIPNKMDQYEIKDRLMHGDYTIDGSYEDFVNNLYDKNKPQYIEYTDIDDWDYENDEPSIGDYITDDMDEEEEEEAQGHFDEAQEKWERERSEMEAMIDENAGYLSHLMDSSIDQFVEQILDDENLMREYLPHLYESGNIDYELESVEETIDEVLENYPKPKAHEDIEDHEHGGWVVHEDETRHLEVTSPILTTKDIPMAMAVLEAVRTAGDATDSSSAHIHIGVPETFDVFDLIALYDLVDEEKILNFQPSRERRYTNLKKTMFHNLAAFLAYDYESGDEIDVDDFKRVRVEKYMGVNISNVMQGVVSTSGMGGKYQIGAGRAIEFRYLSSEVLSDIEHFFEWINYFMLLMKAAERRTQIKFITNRDTNDVIILTRTAKNKIKYDLNKSKMPYEKPAHIKSNTVIPNARTAHLKKVKNIYNGFDKALKETYPKPDFINMPKRSIDDFFLQTPEIAYEYLRRVPNRASGGLEKFIEKASEDYSTAVRLVGELDLLKRNKKAEEQLINLKYDEGQPDNPLKDYKAILAPQAMSYYIKNLCFNHVNPEFGYDQYSRVRAEFETIKNMNDNTKDILEKSQAFFAEVINKYFTEEEKDDKI